MSDSSWEIINTCIVKYGKYVNNEYLKFVIIILAEITEFPLGID